MREMGPFSWFWRMEWNCLVIFSLILNSRTNGGQVFSDSSSSILSSSGSSLPHDEEGPLDPEAAAARERCSFPGRWEGNWFQSGYHQTITITRHSINAKGKCLEAEGEKFIVYNERDNCYRCVAFHEKHQNVLQYKETFCIPQRRSLRSMCLRITGDANLFSMFRLEPVPIECPFRGPFTFTYNRGHGDCRNPVSTIDSCLHSSHLLLNYQACPDVPGTESTAEQLECLATWKEGSSRYLLGLIQYRHPASYEDRFRCFVYEKIKKERGFAGGMLSPSANHHSSSSNNNNSDILFRVSQSGDATCNGLSPHEGSRVLTLRRAPVPKTCQFPSWLQNQKQWHSLDERNTFYFENNELRVSNVTEVGGLSTNILSMTAVCSQIQENPTLDKVLLVLHTTSECRSGFICTGIYRRDGHIIELQIGALARRLEDSCTSAYFDPVHQPFITLISSSPETRQCPNLGQFQVTGLVRQGRGSRSEKCSQEFRSLSVGCDSLDTLQFSSECSHTDMIAEYSCHGSWEEMGVSYLVTSALSRFPGRSRRYCFMFRESPDSRSAGRSEKFGQSSSPFFDEASFSSESPESSDFGRVLMFSSMTDSCHRNLQLGVEGSLAFNVTSQGRCNGASSAESFKSNPAGRTVMYSMMGLGLLLLRL